MPGRHKMKVCHIWNDYSPGLFDTTHQICLEKKIGSEILCARLIDPKSSPPKLLRYIKKVDPKYFSRTDFYARLKNKIDTKVSNYRFKTFLPDFIKSKKPDLLHLHFGHTAIELHRFLETQNVPFMISYYGVDISSELRKPKSVAIYRRLLKRARKAVVLCADAHARLVSLDCEPQKITTWNIPIDGEAYPLRTKAANGPVRFLMAARFVEKKGHRYAIEAFKKLADLRKDVSLTIYGYGPSDWIGRLISEHGIKDQCTLINNQFTANFKAEYYALLKEHDVFLAPSIVAENGDDEGGPALTMIAAQYAGLPVIASRFAGAEISLVDGKTGFYCEQRDSESLFQKMRTIGERPHDWATMGKAGSELVNLEFSPSRQADKLLQIYKGALS